MPATTCEAAVLIAVIARALVLLVASLGALICIYLGWRLYKDAVISRSEGTLEGAGWKLTLTAASPGLFLIAFGIWLLISLVNRTTSIEQSVSTATERKADWKATLLTSSATAASSRLPSATSATTEDASQGTLKPPSSSCQCPCPLKSTKIAFFPGTRPLDAPRIRDAMRKSIKAITRARDNAIPDVSDRAALVETLLEIEEAAVAAEQEQ